MTDKPNISLRLNPTHVSQIGFCDVDNTAIMTIHADGKITLGKVADPTDAASQCIKAMSDTIKNLIHNAVKAERAAIAEWLISQWSPGCLVDYHDLASVIKNRQHLQQEIDQ